MITMSSSKLLQIGIVLNLSCILVLCSCPNGRIAAGINNNDKYVIVNKHNECRLKIARGEVQGQPRGTNLKRMKWDDSLAAKAQEISDTCVWAHVTVTGTRWQWVGQNLYKTWTSQQDNEGPNWNAAIQSWFDEHQLYTYPNGFHSKTGHYTQVVWADTDYVGCGYTYYKEDNQFNKFYVCNYGPGGNVNNQPPYNTDSGNCPNLC